MVAVPAISSNPVNTHFNPLPPPTPHQSHYPPLQPLPLFCTCASFQSSFSHSQLQPFLSIHLFSIQPPRHNLLRSQTPPALPAPNNLWCSHANSSHLYKLMGLSILPCRRTFSCTTHTYREATKWKVRDSALSPSMVSATCEYYKALGAGVNWTTLSAVAALSNETYLTISRKAPGVGFCFQQHQLYRSQKTECLGRAGSVTNFDPWWVIKAVCPSHLGRWSPMVQLGCPQIWILAIHACPPSFPEYPDPGPRRSNLIIYDRIFLGELLHATEFSSDTDFDFF